MLVGDRAALRLAEPHALCNGHLKLPGEHAGECAPVLTITARASAMQANACPAPPPLPPQAVPEAPRAQPAPTGCKADGERNTAAAGGAPACAAEVEELPETPPRVEVTAAAPAHPPTPAQLLEPRSVSPAGPAPRSRLAPRAEGDPGQESLARGPCQAVCAAEAGAQGEQAPGKAVQAADQQEPSAGAPRDALAQQPAAAAACEPNAVAMCDPRPCVLFFV